jgi:REP element-mobilizing transposase RayT
MSYISSYFHCVFSTKERRQLITPELRERLWPFIGGIARQNKMKAVEIGGVEDHVHILLSLPSTIVIAKAMHSSREALLNGFMKHFRTNARLHGRVNMAHSASVCRNWTKA